MVMPINEAGSVDVGGRLRKLRDERGISMRALARQSSLSANALSMIERGLTSPSVSTLSKLSNALGVPITAFFREQTDRHPIVYCKAQERSCRPFLQGLWEGMGGESFAGQMDAFALTSENGATSGQHGVVHSGSEFAICLSGILEVVINHEKYTLEPGDTILFDANLVHFWKSPGGIKTTAVFVVASYVPGDFPREHHIAS
jgi:transcriptional regulator with XRE-family HTH domain/quercetin dioxygenase-like cupin family protein